MVTDNSINLSLIAENLKKNLANSKWRNFSLDYSVDENEKFLWITSENGITFEGCKFTSLLFAFSSDGVCDFFVYRDRYDNSREHETGYILSLQRISSLKIYEEGGSLAFSRQHMFYHESNAHAVLFDFFKEMERIAKIGV